MVPSADSKPRILVVDDDAEIRELIIFFIESQFPVQVVAAENGLVAKEILEKDPLFQIVVSDYHMPKMNGGELLQYIKSTNLLAKFILLSATDPDSAVGAKVLKPDALAEKPFFAEALKAALQKFLPKASNQDHSGEYVRVSIRNLFQLGSIPHALYARLSESKYIRVVCGHDIFGNEETEQFKKKGITHLYIKHEHANAFFKQLMEVYLALSQRESMSEGDMLAVSAEINSAIQDMASSFGFSPELEQVTKTGVNLALKTIETNPSLRKLFEQLSVESDNYLAIHCSRLPYLANYISKLMGWVSGATAEKMALASFLHDSILSLPNEMTRELEHGQLLTSLSPNAYQVFVQHPVKAAKMVAKFTEIPPDVDIIIAQHHESCKGTGYPMGLNHTRIAPLSCVFIVAHDLLCFYEKAQNNFKIDDFIAQKQNEYTAGYFKKILDELVVFSFD